MLGILLICFDFIGGSLLPHHQHSFDIHGHPSQQEELEHNFKRPTPTLKSLQILQHFWWNEFEGLY